MPTLSILKSLTTSVSLVFSTTLLLFLILPSSTQAATTTITLDPSTTYQTMTGWEATSQACQNCSGFSTYQDKVLNWAVELGINRLRVELRDTTTNNTEDIDPSQLDGTITEVVNPFKNRMIAGDKFNLNLITVGVASSNGTDKYFTQPDDSSNYPPLILNTFNYINNTYGYSPDMLEISLEPTVFNTFGANKDENIGKALVSTAQLLNNNGYYPDFIASSHTNLGYGITHFSNLLTVSDIKNYITEYSFHCYGGCTPNDPTTGLYKIGDLASNVNLNNGKRLKTSQLEHIGRSARKLHDDLKNANVSAWQQYTLAYTSPDNGAQYFPITGTTVSYGWRTKELRHYFKYIRIGSQRISASSSDCPDDRLSCNQSFDPVAFKKANGYDINNYTIVIKARNVSGQSVTINNLPNATYGIMLTTATGEANLIGNDLNDNSRNWGMEQSSVVVSNNQLTLPEDLSSGGTGVYKDVNNNPTNFNHGFITIYCQSNCGGSTPPTNTPTNFATPTPTSIPGDANGDGLVDGIDYIIWLNNYNQSTGNGPADGDFNSSGFVDGVDYIIWLNNYGG